jgi:transcription elongation factor GreB
MSKAFTREDDGVPVPPLRRLGVPVPEPNYMTASGVTRLRAELARTPPGDRQRELAEHLATAVIVEPGRTGEVGLGAWVTVEGGDGTRSRYRIVGAIEASPRDGAIGWQSPIGSALIGARVGDTVALPRGEVEIVAIDPSDER